MSRVKYSADFVIEQSAGALFPLFSAEGEKLWVPGWDYEGVTGTSEFREDTIFLTKNHDHAARDAIWLVKKYRPDDGLVEFYKVEPGEKVGVIRVKCTALSEAETQVTVTYEYIALSQKGQAFINRFTALEYKKFMGEWQQLLEAYFAGRSEV